jgi:hypothetical protein
MAEQDSGSKTTLSAVIKILGPKGGSIAAGILIINLGLLALLFYFVVQQQIELRKWREAMLHAAEALANGDRGLPNALKAPLEQLTNSHNLSSAKLSEWELVKAEKMDPNIFVAIQSDPDTPPFPIYKDEAKLLMKTLLGATKEATGDRYAIVPVRQEGKESFILLDKSRGNTWTLRGSDFKLVHMDRRPDLERSNTPSGDLVDVLIERGAGRVLRRAKKFPVPTGTP